MRRYLDHNATSPVRPQVQEAMLAAMKAGGNASSIHHEGRQARQTVDAAREEIAAQLGCLAEMITFTASGTEANNMALRAGGIERLVISAIEHPSILAAAKAAALPVQVVPVLNNGVIDHHRLRGLLEAGTGRALVCTMLANNETGVLQPVREMADIVHEAGHLLHCDAVQAFGKIPVRFAMLDADMMSLSAHKLGGPQGIGALIVRDGIALAPLVCGGGQESGRRAGTENVAAIAGFAAAVKSIDNKIKPQIRMLRDRFEAELMQSDVDVTIFGQNAGRLPNTSCFSHPGIKADTALISFDLEGIAVSSGSACSSGKVATSHVLAAMGAEAAEIGGAIRVSFGWNNIYEDVDAAIAAWRKILKRHKRHIAA